MRLLGSSAEFTSKNRDSVVLQREVERNERYGDMKCYLKESGFYRLDFS